MMKAGFSHSHRSLNILIITTILALTTIPAQAGTYSGGTGEPNDPYLIANPNDLLELAETTDDYSDYFKMINDINLVNYTFTKAVIAPDTDGQYPYDGTMFSGTLDGNNYAIKNLQIIQLSSDYIGLFGYTASGSQIKNLTLTNAYLEGNQFVGGIVGDNSASIYSCSVEAYIQSDYGYAGGIAGYNNSPISFSNSSSIVKGCQYLGGLTGWNNGDIDHCNTNGLVQINIDNGWLVGGLVGIQAEGFVTDSYSTCSVIGSN